MSEIPWFKVDDRFHSSRKVKAIPRTQRLEAVGLWALAGSWSAGEGLDGYVPDYMVEDFGGTDALVAALIKSGLWEVVEGGAQFYKWTEYNPDAASIEAAKDAQSEGAKHANHKRWHAKRKIKVPGCEWCESVPHQLPDQYTESYPNPPDPTRPDPIDGYVPEVSLVSSEVETTSRPDVEALCKLLADLIEENGSKRPTIGKNWQDAARLLIDKDGRRPDQIERAIRWCQSDEFWRGNILSMPKLRDKYDQLRLQAAREQQPPSDKPTRGQEHLAFIASLAGTEQQGIES